MLLLLLTCLGGALGYLYGVDLRSKKPLSSPGEYAIAGAILFGVLAYAGSHV